MFVYAQQNNYRQRDRQTDRQTNFVALPTSANLIYYTVGDKNFKFNISWETNFTTESFDIFLVKKCWDIVPNQIHISSFQGSPLYLIDGDKNFEFNFFKENVYCRILNIIRYMQFLCKDVGILASHQVHISPNQRVLFII